MKKGFSEALSFFHKTAGDTPAYAQFLSSNNVDPRTIQSEEDFIRLPTVSKKNYLNAYPYRTLFPNEQIPTTISASSGSSGVPFFWPRGHHQDIDGGMVHERIFREIFQIHEKRTLVIVCFAMGSWIGGTFTKSACEWVAEQEGYHLSVATPGIEMDDVMRVLQHLAPFFESVVIAGYPPFVMDVVHTASAQQISLQSYDLHFLLAGENFSDDWRIALHSVAGIQCTYTSSVTIYGTADAGVLGHETPGTQYLRILIYNTSELANLLNVIFGFSPSVVQYDETKRFFEVDDGMLLFTADAGLPLIRYTIGDSGQLFEKDRIVDVVRSVCGDDEANRLEQLLWDCPIIILGQRYDVSASFYALNIYPEHIYMALSSEELLPFVTGKFMVDVQSINDHKDQHLIIHVELKYNVVEEESLLERTHHKITEYLERHNAEYHKLRKELGERARAHVVFHPHGDEQFIIKHAKHKRIQ